jgi:hypothetical protein
MAVNMGPDVALEDCFYELFDLLGAALDLKLNPAIRKVPYPTGDIEPLSDLLHRKAETNPLNPTFEKSAFRRQRFHDQRKTNSQ